MTLGLVEKELSIRRRRISRKQSPQDPAECRKPKGDDASEQAPCTIDWSNVESEVESQAALTFPIGRDNRPTEKTWPPTHETYRERTKTQLSERCVCDIARGDQHNGSEDTTKEPNRKPDQNIT